MAITFLSNLTVSGGGITLEGTGRIQGVDTVTANTDAANKLYVDNAVAGVPQGDITAVVAGTGLSGGGTSGSVTLNNTITNNNQLTNGAGYTTNVGDITGVTAGTGMSGGGTSGSVTLNCTITNNNQLTNGSGYTTNTGTTTASNSQTFTNKGGNISQWTNNSGYTTNAGSVTSVAQTHTGNAFDISGSPITGSGTLAIDVVGSSAQYITGEGNLATTITNNNQLTNGAGYTTNTGTTTAGNTQTFTNKSGDISQWTNNSGYTTNAGDITGVTAGTGMSGGGTSGSVTLNCDIAAANNATITIAGGDGLNVNSGASGNFTTNQSSNETLTINMDYGGADNFILASAAAVGTAIQTTDKIIYSDVGDSDIYYGNVSDLPFTNNSGDITNVTAGTGMSGGGTSGSVTLNCDITNNNQLTNGAGYTTNTGDITGVTAGSGLTGGGTSGGVTVSVDYGSAGLIADCPSGTGSIGENDFIMIGQDESASGETRSFEVQELPFLSSSTTVVTNWTVNSTLNVRGVIDLADNDILRFGTGDDVEMYFSGSDMFMDINNGEDFKIRDGNSGNATRFTFDADTGDFTATGNVSAYSDVRLKDNIKTLDGSKVLEMRGVSFTKDGKESSGVIAQELEKVAPELVMTHENEDGIKSVAYGNLVGYLIEAVKEQQKQIDELKIKLSDISK